MHLVIVRSITLLSVTFLSNSFCFFLLLVPIRRPLTWVIFSHSSFLFAVPLNGRWRNSVYPFFTLCHYVGSKNTFLFSLTRSLLNQSPRNDISLSTFPKVWPFSFILSFFLPGNWFPCLEAFSQPSFLPLHPNLFPNRLYFTKNQGMSYKKYLHKLCWNSILTENFPFILGFNLHVRISKLICI